MPGEPESPDFGDSRLRPDARRGAERAAVDLSRPARSREAPYLSGRPGRAHGAATHVPRATADAGPPWLLRWSDQWGVAAMVGVAMLLMIVWCIRAWWGGGGLVAVESLPQEPASYQVDVNTAPWIELAQLPLVGERIARSIVAYRERHGPFRSLEELQNVEGIAAGRLARMTPHLSPIAAPSSATGPTASRLEVLLADADHGESESQMPLAAQPHDARIDINTATAATLDRLPGIGEVLSQRIVDSRNLDGPFRSVDELERVSGIGPKTVEKIRPFACVGP